MALNGMTFIRMIYTRITFVRMISNTMTFIRMTLIEETFIGTAPNKNDIQPNDYHQMLRQNDTQQNGSQQNDSTVLHSA